jgi:CRISPR-associated endoribonuclease Cas6
MPVKTKILLHLERPVQIIELLPERIHALFFSILPEKVSQELHSIKGTKPFTVCFKDFFGKDGKEEVKRISLTVTLLKDELFPLLSEGIILGKKELKIGGVGISSKRITSSEHKTYQRLMEEGKVTRDFLFFFQTPTTFKKGHSDYPLPEPALIFKSLLRKWNSYSEEKLELSLAELSKMLQVGGFWIKTRKLPVSQNAKLTGFTGRVFINARIEDEETLKKLYTLASFAEFSGVGRKTTMGFGKVSLIRDSTTS